MPKIERGNQISNLIFDGRKNSILSQTPTNAQQRKKSLTFAADTNLSISNLLTFPARFLTLKMLKYSLSMLVLFDWTDFPNMKYELTTLSLMSTLQHNDISDLQSCLRFLLHAATILSHPQSRRSLYPNFTNQILLVFLFFNSFFYFIFHFIFFLLYFRDSWRDIGEVISQEYPSFPPTAGHSALPLPFLPSFLPQPSSISLPLLFVPFLPFPSFLVRRGPSHSCF